MNKCCLAAMIVASLATYVRAQTNTQGAISAIGEHQADSATQQTKIDPGKAADIRHLMDVMGTKATMMQVMGKMEESIKPLMTNALPPGNYREQLVELFFAKFHAKADVQELVNSIVPVYDKYYSDDDIKGLIQFYQTPLGQKALTVMPKLLSESQDKGKEWGEQLGRNCMSEVLAEHPDLKKALEEAATGSTHD